MVPTYKIYNKPKTRISKTPVQKYKKSGKITMSAQVCRLEEWDDYNYGKWLTMQCLRILTDSTARMSVGPLQNQPDIIQSEIFRINPRSSGTVDIYRREFAVWSWGISVMLGDLNSWKFGHQNGQCKQNWAKWWRHYVFFWHNAVKTFRRVTCCCRFVHLRLDGYTN